jgi:hypothetical protein
MRSIELLSPPDWLQSSLAQDRLRRMPRSFVANFSSPRNLKRALKTVIIVGPLLVVINQTLAVAVLRISLTLLVPFGVSLYSSAMADRAREANEEDS